MVTAGADGTPGINGGLMKNTDVKTTTNTIGVDSVDASVEAVIKAGGKQVMPKTAIPTVGYFVYLTDTEGNLFGVMQADKNAKGDVHTRTLIDLGPALSRIPKTLMGLAVGG